MKRVCEGCRALGVRYYGGVHPSPYWHCKLGYPIRTVGKWQTGDHAEPTAECPKPRTYHALFQCDQVPKQPRPEAE